MYFVYILECNDKTLYTGITNDLKRRLKTHKNKQGGNYTRAHGAHRIIYSEKHNTKSSALKREAKIKRLPRHKKVSLANGTS